MSGISKRTHVSGDHLQDSLQAACLLEATARKPGNVHPGASFLDLSYEHFVQAADQVPVLARSAQQGQVGRAVYEGVEATRGVVPSNANLGIVLLLAPLAAVPWERTLSEGIAGVLERLTVDDASWVYRAIRLANPGGLGEIDEQDVSSDPTETLLRVMQLAAERDRIAYQYANQFVDVFDVGVPCLCSFRDFECEWETAIIALQLELLARIPDSLIRRKCGLEVAQEASRRAQQVLEAGWPEAPDSEVLLADFDRWLRSDGNRRNPGTTADLIAACLFAAFRDRLLPIPDLNRLSITEESASS